MIKRKKKSLFSELGEAISAAIMELSLHCNSGRLTDNEVGTSKVVIEMLERAENRLYGIKN